MPSPSRTVIQLQPQRPEQVIQGRRKSVTDLEVAIHSYLAEHNDRPKPFVWTAKPSDILEKVRRGKQALESEQ